jgi:hypothetical protein
VKFSLFIALSFFISIVSAQETSTVKISSDVDPTHHLILERSGDLVSMTICKNSDNSCTLIGDGSLSLSALDRAMWETRDQGNYPLYGAALGSSAGPTVLMSCIFFKKCITAMRALSANARSNLYMYTPLAGAVVGGVAGVVLQEKAIDQEFVDRILRGTTSGEIKIEESLNDIIEDYSMLLIQLRNRE